mgnify:CR=1 FL=1
MSAIENLSVTTMRNIIGDMDLQQTLTSRDTINGDNNFGSLPICGRLERLQGLNLNDLVVGTRLI